MKKLFIPARYEREIKLSKNLIELLPKKVAIFSSIQFYDSLVSVKKQVEDSGRKVFLLKTKHTKFAGQLLGCNIEKFVGGGDGFLYIGDGQFHPKALMLKNNKPVFAYNPFSNKYSELKKGDVEDLKKRMKGAYVKFLSSDNIGVLISTKFGQYNLKEGLALKKKYVNKNFYFLMFDNINPSSLEDFPFIDMFVNTACPRMIDDYKKFPKPILNIDDLNKN